MIYLFVSELLLIFLLDYYLIKRAKKGKRTAIPLIIYVALSILVGFLIILGSLDDPNIEYSVEFIIFSSTFSLNCFIMIFITDYLANSSKKK